VGGVCKMARIPLKQEEKLSRWERFTQLIIYGTIIKLVNINNKKNMAQQISHICRNAQTSTLTIQG